tara:strand:- start:7410 stop:9320 length:1911 start_codon:yes stop_codon:yes gene_type:complete
MKLFDFTADKNKLSSQITESISVNEEESVNESLQALAKHVKEGTALCDSPFRHGSKAYIETFQLAKKLREAGSLPELDWESEEMLATDIGEQVTLKGGKKVWLDIPYLNEEEDEGMIGEPDDYYDAEERTEAYDELQDALQGNYMDDYIKDGVCPACGGNGYMDGEEEMYNDETDEYEEGLECDGFGKYGCDEGEMTYGSDGPSWVEIIKHDKGNAERQKSRDEYPGDEEVIKQVASYMKRMDDPRQAYQQMQADFPHMGRGQRSEILGKASKMAFGENINEGEERSIIQDAVVDHLIDTFGGENWMIFADTREQLESRMYDEIETLSVDEVVDPEMEVGGQPIGNFASGRVLDVIDSSSAIESAMQYVEGLDEGMMDLDDLPMIKSYNTPEENAVGKILGRALMKKDWAKYSPQELFAELESENPELADDIAKVAKIVYNVKLEERAFKDVGVADVVKDTRGKEFKFNKDSKMFKAIDGSEEADVKTKLGKDLMRRRRNAMKRTSPSYPKNKKMMDGKSPHKKGTKKYKKHMAAIHAGESVTNEAEYQGKKVELNKPKRGGSKKYYVYVKNPKTDRVKKISFGDVTGLKTKAGNKKRAKSFAARHNCEKKNDKMKAGYWACRLPRYGLVKGGKWW